MYNSKETSTIDRWPGSQGSSSDTIHLLQVVVNGQLLGLPVGTITEILPMAALSLPPRSPSILAGFLNLGGIVLPIFRLSVLLGATETSSGLETRIILLRGKSYRFGVIADEVKQVITVSSGNASSVNRHPFIKTVVSRAEQVIPVVSVEDFLMEEERTRILELTECRQRRLSELQGVTP